MNQAKKQQTVWAWFVTLVGGFGLGFLFAAFVWAQILLSHEEVIQFWSDLIK